MVSENQVRDTIKRFPTLTYCSSSNRLYGELFATPSDGYKVDIHLDNFPERFPDVYEIGARIPPKADRHIYTDSGKCCLTTRAKEQIILKTRVRSLHDFIALIVIPYLQNNSFFELNECYKLGEYTHGVEGIIEGYRDILKLENSIQTYLVLDSLKSRIIRTTDPCYCKSGNTLKKCRHGIHLNCYKDFRLIDKSIFEDDFNKFIAPFIREVLIYNRFYN